MFLPIGVYPLRQRRIRSKLPFPLAKDKKIRKSICPRAREQLIRKAHRANQFALLGKFAPQRLVLFIHRSMTCYSNNKAAGTYLVHHFFQEIIMDEVVLRIICIGDDVVSERNVRYGKIKRMIGEARALKSPLYDPGIVRGIAGNLRRQEVKLHAYANAFSLHSLRHILQKTPCSGRRIEDVSCLESRLMKPLINGLDNFRRRVERIQRRCTGRCKFGIRHDAFCLFILTVPRCITCVKRLRDSPEAGV